MTDPAEVTIAALAEDFGRHVPPELARPLALVECAIRCVVAARGRAADTREACRCLADAARLLADAAGEPLAELRPREVA